MATELGTQLRPIKVTAAKCWMCGAGSWRWKKIEAQCDSQPFLASAEIVDAQVRRTLIVNVQCLECRTSFEMRTDRPVEFG